MMTWAWTLTWVLLNPARKPDPKGITAQYLVQLVGQLSPWEYLYSEIVWSDPIL